jgi:hypothetical protein
MRVRGQDSQCALSFGYRAAIAAEAGDAFAEPGFELVDPGRALVQRETSAASPLDGSGSLALRRLAAGLPRH